MTIRRCSIKYLHIGHLDKFHYAYIETIRSNFNFSEHEFLLCDGSEKYKIQSYAEIHTFGTSKIQNFKFLLAFILKAHFAERIVLHGLFKYRIEQVLFFMPWLLSRCCWVIWGGDLYFHLANNKSLGWRIREFIRRNVIKNIGALITYIKGDYELAQKWYGAKGAYIMCLMYPSNLYQSLASKSQKHTEQNLLIGNSADPSNNHLEIFIKLQKLGRSDFNLIVPLTYGDESYIQSIVSDGKRRFGNRFHPITDHMTFEDYMHLLSKVDIAIFNHRRQQAMGNTISLLGMGKKVYIRSDVTPWAFFKSINVTVYDTLNTVDLNRMDQCTMKKNMEHIQSFFSEKHYINQLEVLFGKCLT